MSTGLAIFVKTPGHSPIKTRLARDIGRADAEQFHRLAAEAVASVARAAGEALTPYWAVAEATALGESCWQDLPRLAQGDGDLGQRLDHICAQLLARHERALLIGADAPQITPALLHQAITALDRPGTDFVLGPATDGGFWLFGTRIAVPAAVWQAPAYSRPTTGADLCKASMHHGHTARLATLGDVDTADQFTVLARDLDALASLTAAQQHLRQWLTMHLPVAGPAWNPASARHKIHSPRGSTP